MEDGDWSESDWDSSASEAETDCEDEVEGEERKRKVIRVYEWSKSCWNCGMEDVDVCLTRVEIETSGDLLCYALGNNPMKTLVRKEGVMLGQVALPSASNQKSFLGRACPRCCAAQGELELVDIIEQKDPEWLISHRILSIPLPRWSRQFKLT